MVAVTWFEQWRPELMTGARILLVCSVGVVVNALARRSIARVVGGIRTAARELDQRIGSLSRADQARRTDARADTLNSVLRSLATTVILVTVTLIVLGQLQINLAPLIAGAGVASIALGFGVQSLVRDVVAGLFVLIEDQYGVGDTIDAGAATGEVERFTLRVTRLRDTAGTVWHIPNGSIPRVGNKSQTWARAVVEVVVPADSDVAAARAAIVAVATSMATEDAWSPSSITGTPVDQGVVALSPAGATLRVVVDTVPAAQWRVERELRQRILADFRARGVALATTE